MKALYEKYRSYLVCILATFLALLMLPHGIYNNPDFGLDPSWGIAINLAVKNKLIFGKDFVFTYGPLGFLQTRLSIGVPEIAYVLFDVFVLLNFGFAFFRIMVRSNLLFSFLIIFLCTWIVSREPALILLWLVLFYVFEYLKTQSWVILANLIVLAVVAFFLKLSTGFIPPIFAVLAIIYGVRARIISFITASIIIVVYTSLVFALAIPLHVDLLSFFRESLHIIDGYNDAMYVRVDTPDATDVLRWAVACVAVFVATGLYFLRKILRDEFLTLLFICSSMFLFVLFKVSFTRFHYHGYFSLVTPIYGVLLLHAAKEMKRFMIVGLVFCLVVSISIVGHVDRVGLLFPVNTIRFIADEIGLYYKLSTNYPGDSPSYSTYPDYFRLPDKLTESIGQSSVDILPYDIAVLTSKGLNYRGRPVIQSYCVFDGRLDQLNADFYASDSAPEYLLFNSDEIDGRYGMFSETLLKIEMLKDYTTVDRSWHHILLKRLKKPLTSTIVKTDAGEVNFEQKIKLADGDNLQVAFANVEYSLIGKIRRLFYQPPNLSVTLYMEGDVQASFKCIQTNARDGIIINRFVPNNDPAELALFVNSNGTLSKRVKAIRFHSNFPAGFKSTIKYRIEHHRFEGQRKDLSSWDPVQLGAKISKDSVAATIDLLTSSVNRIEVQGWAFNKSRPLAKYSIFLAIGPPDSLLAFKSELKIYRPDVAAVFKLKNDSTGFKVVIPGNFVKHKSDELTVLLVDDLGNTSALKFDRRVEVGSADARAATSEMGEIGVGDLPPVSEWIPEKLEFNFDAFDEDEDYLHITGWAFPKDPGLTADKPFTIYVSFENGQQRRIFKTVPSSRPDVSEYFHNNAVDRCGLDFEIDKSKLPAGSWNLVLLVEFEGKVYSGLYDRDKIDVKTKDSTQ